jgi:hypothetical protein
MLCEGRGAYHIYRVMLSNVKWNNRQMIPINSNCDTATPLPDGFEKSIGEQDITQIEKWMNETSINIKNALEEVSVDNIYRKLGIGNTDMNFQGFSVVPFWLQRKAQP